MADVNKSVEGMRGASRLGALLVDLNGTLHVGSSPTRGAVQALEKLRRTNVPFLFCSNSTKESTKSLLQNMRSMGFKVDDKELMTSLGACRALVEQRKLRKVVASVDPLLLLSPSAKEEFEHIDIDERAYDSVIVGLDPPSLSYEPLNKAFRVLKGEPLHADSKPQTAKQPSLIAPHASLYQQSEQTDDLPAGLSLGIGPFVKALELASGVEAELVGKPTKRFFELALQRLKEQGWDGKGEVGIIGDDVKNDLGDGARELGLKRFLVRTGKYRDGGEEGHELDGVYDDFSTFVDDLE